MFFISATASQACVGFGAWPKLNAVELLLFILSGYLRKKYAQDKPLTVSASIAFEQSYGGVDGDSASSTELYAFLSSLSGMPIKQYIAVTGSVNQKGEVQAIGGVNQKIEGFYDCCRMKGLTGKQGVMIPESNVKDLMLRKNVVEAVKEGQFHIFSVKNIDEGIEILTNTKAVERKADGTYPKGTINYLVDQKLRELAEGLKKFGLLFFVHKGPSPASTAFSFEPGGPLGIVLADPKPNRLCRNAKYFSYFVGMKFAAMC